MKSALYVLILAFVPIMLEAQDREIVVRNFDVNLSDLRAKTDPVPDLNNNPTALVEVSFPAVDSIMFICDKIVGTPIHNPGKWTLYLSEGAEQMEIAVPGYRVLTFVFPADKRLVSSHVYTLDLAGRVINPLRTLVMPSFSYNSSHMSYGLMLGFCKTNGGYVHAKTDFNFGIEIGLECEGDGRIGQVPGWFTGESKKSRIAITAGYMGQIIPPLYLYIGGGYGSRLLAWKTYLDGGSYQYAKVTTHSFSGIEVETGLILRVGSVSFSVGVQTNQFKYFEANAGIGFMF